MSNVLIINGHQPYPFAKGRLNATLVEEARTAIAERRWPVQLTEVAKGWEVDAEVQRHQWADIVLLQFPVNWMGVPWSLKKYMDEVYTAGMDGRLCSGDGRTREHRWRQYGMGGTLEGTRYMLSLTFNAPREAFDDPEQEFFGGRSVDDLLWPMHLNMKFFAMTPLPTFSAHDVMKNPEVDRDLVRFREHLGRWLLREEEVVAEAG